MSLYSRVVGTGSHLPERRLSNADLVAQLAQTGVETSDEWIVERTGIRARHFAADGQFSSDLALEACRQALNMAGLGPEDIDLLVVATSTLNRIMVVELALPALVPGLLVGFHYAIQMVRPRMGFGADQGRRNTPWMLGGMAVLAHPSLGGIRIAPELLFGKLYRLLGADAVIFTGYGGRFAYSPITARPDFTWPGGRRLGGRRNRGQQGNRQGGGENDGGDGSERGHQQCPLPVIRGRGQWVNG